MGGWRGAPPIKRRPEEQNRISQEEEILPQGDTINACLSSQPARTCSTDFGLGSPENTMNQFLKVKKKKNLKTQHLSHWFCLSGELWWICGPFGARVQTDSQDCEGSGKQGGWKHQSVNLRSGWQHYTCFFWKEEVQAWSDSCLHTFKRLKCGGGVRLVLCYSRNQNLALRLEVTAGRSGSTVLRVRTNGLRATSSQGMGFPTEQRYVEKT